MGAQHRFKSNIFMDPKLTTKRFEVKPYEHTMLDAMTENLLYIDPDSSRIVDWVTFTRSKQGFATVVYNHEFRKRNDQEFATMKAVVKKHFNHSYDSKYMLRCFSIAGVENPQNPSGPLLPVMRSYCALEMTGQGVALTVIGDPEFNGPIVQELSELYPDADKLAFVDLQGFDGNGAPITSKVELDPDDKSLDLAHNAFYPVIQDKGLTVHELIQAYGASKAAVMLLWGPRGTGKTTFGRTMGLLLGTGDNVFMCSQENAFMNPAFGLWLESLPENSLVFIEDADNLVAKRRDGNHQMSMILNKADGIVKKGLKLVFSTNLSSFATIDEALLRPGRCFGTFEFNKLTPEEANAARQAIGLEPVEGIEKPLTLAEALNFEDIGKPGERSYEGFGFLNGRSKLSEAD